MRIRLIAAGTRLPAWIDAGVEEYARRFGRGLKFELVEIPLAREAERMRAAIGASDYVVALEVGGRDMTTAQLAKWLDARMAGGKNLALL
ncbi:MAG: 23S rRNA (pseudouridine(1915)-N(3))-methyltransferase RlmH, partial [Actinomycetota bacterium]|nr:23S rRNA (pseudouridine(1915)-N(3))-methyltransferase RlmH [Actinomycetota bacterium]